MNNEQVVWRIEHHYDVPLTTYNTCPVLGLMILHEWTWTIEQSTIIVPVSHFRFQVFHGPTFWLEYISVPRHDPFNCLGRHLSTILAHQLRRFAAVRRKVPCGKRAQEGRVTNQEKLGLIVCRRGGWTYNTGRLAVSAWQVTYETGSNFIKNRVQFMINFLYNSVATTCRRRCEEYTQRFRDFDQGPVNCKPCRLVQIDIGVRTDW